MIFVIFHPPFPSIFNQSLASRGIVRPKAQRKRLTFYLLPSVRVSARVVIAPSPAEAIPGQEH